MKLRNLTEIIESLQLAAFVLMAPVVLTSLLLAFLSGGWWCLAGGYSAVWVVTFVIQSLDMPEPDEKYPHAITAVTLYPLLLVAWLIICLIQWAQHRIDLKNPRIAEILLTQQRIEEMQRALEVFSVSTDGEALYKKLGNELNMQEKELQHLRSYPREEAERVAEEIRRRQVVEAAEMVEVLSEERTARRELEKDSSQIVAAAEEELRLSTGQQSFNRQG